MKDKIIKIAEELFGTGITLNSKLGNIEKWDSLGHLSLFMELENNFNIKFSQDEILESTSIEKIINLILKKI